SYPAGRPGGALSRKYSRLQRDEADAVGGDDARSGARRKRAAADGARDGKLPHPAYRDGGTDARDSGQSRGRQPRRNPSDPPTETESAFAAHSRGDEAD